jgi:hypothetical protein
MKQFAIDIDRGLVWLSKHWVMVLKPFKCMREINYYLQHSYIYVYVDITFSFAQHRYVWFPSYYFCTGLMLLSQLNHRCFAINHGCSISIFSDVVFLWSEGVSGATVHKRLSAQNGNSGVCMKWLKNYKLVAQVWTHEGARWSSIITNEDNIEHAYGMVLLDRWVTIDEVVNHPQIAVFFDR